jgi:hypothetical protein
MTGERARSAPLLADLFSVQIACCAENPPVIESLNCSRKRSIKNAAGVNSVTGKNTTLATGGKIAANAVSVGQPT